MDHRRARSIAEQRGLLAVLAADQLAAIVGIICGQTMRDHRAVRAAHRHRIAAFEVAVDRSNPGGEQAALLGYAPRSAVVHRDQMVLL